MTKEYLLSKTLHGVDIIQHLIRKEFPDHIMKVKGTDCGDCPDPVRADGQMLDGDALSLDAAYYHERREDLTQEQLIARLAEELYIKEPRKPSFKKEQPELPPCPSFVSSPPTTTTSSTSSTGSGRKVSRWPIPTPPPPVMPSSPPCRDTSGRTT